MVLGRENIDKYMKLHRHPYEISQLNTLLMIMKSPWY